MQGRWMMRAGTFGLAVLLAAGCGQEGQEIGGAQTAAAAPPGETQLVRQKTDASPPVDLLTLAEGAVLVSASVDPAKALALTDGDAASNWSAGTRRNPPPYTFVFELRAETRLSRVGIDGSGPRPGGVAGGSAKAVRIEASATGPDVGFVEIAKLDAAPDGETLADVSGSAPARWLRFTVEGAQTAADWVYFDEVIAHGEQTPPQDADRFTGVYRIGRSDLLEMKQDGSSVTGCFVENGGRSNGRLSGSVVDGVARLTWVSEQNITGSAVLTIDSRGELSGVRYRDRSRTVWAGPPAPEGTTTPCSATPPSNPVADALAASGEARIYGILFDHDSDVPTASSYPALRQLKEALLGSPDIKVDIEGHTDSDGADAYNLSLSDRRAKAVVKWLVGEGVPAARINGIGKGEAEPVATNDTADGKALNRRVDVAVR